MLFLKRPQSVNLLVQLSVCVCVCVVVIVAGVCVAVCAVAVCVCVCVCGCGVLWLLCGGAVVAVYLGYFRRRLRNGLRSPDGLSFLAAFRRCELGSICLMLDCIVVVCRQLLLQR